MRALVVLAAFTITSVLLLLLGVRSLIALPVIGVLAVVGVLYGAYCVLTS